MSTSFFLPSFSEFLTPLFTLGFFIACGVVVYWIIRFAVRHALIDAARHAAAHPTHNDAETPTGSIPGEHTTTTR